VLVPKHQSKIALWTSLAPQALVPGTESEGLAYSTWEKCDLLARLPVASAVESLNVSNAAAIALYAGASRSPK
jgi:23S rRNA (guanosine2251-2'-O)-methyltransferase